jgi:hypothetical protein
MTSDFKELDTVVYRGEERPPVLPGMVGAIVMIYDPISRVYEVEFFDDNHRALPTVTVLGEHLEPWTP